MRKIALLSHCILNPFCEFEEPAAKDFYRKIVKRLMDEDIGIIQLPCPEFTYQGLERTSIVPESEGALKYSEFNKVLIEDLVKNLKEYKNNGIKAGVILGIDTSPSCSAVDKTALMTRELFKRLEDEGIEIEKIDVPVVPLEDIEGLMKSILAVF